MYWSDIHEWSKKKLLGYTIAFYVLYAALLVIIPAIIIAARYGLFSNAPTSEKINGIWIVFFTILGFGLYFVCRRLFSKIPDSNINWRRFKFGIEGVFAMLPFILVLIIMSNIKDDMVKAYDTLKFCLWFILASCVVDAVWVKFLDWEWKARADAQYSDEIDKRKHK